MRKVYAAKLAAAGFESVQVEPIREQVFPGWHRALVDDPGLRLRLGPGGWLLESPRGRLHSISWVKLAQTRNAAAFLRNALIATRKEPLGRFDFDLGHWHLFLIVVSLGPYSRRVALSRMAPPTDEVSWNGIYS
jgi:hypothetical protein